MVVRAKLAGRPGLLAADSPELVADEVGDRVVELLLVGGQLVLDTPGVALLEQLLTSTCPA